MGAAHDIGPSERIALIPSICILRSVGGMRVVASHVPGIDVPPSTVARVEQAANAQAECFEIAIPPTNRKRVQWIQCSGLALGP